MSALESLKQSALGPTPAGGGGKGAVSWLIGRAVMTGNGGTAGTSLDGAAPLATNALMPARAHLLGVHEPQGGPCAGERHLAAATGLDPFNSVNARPRGGMQRRHEVRHRGLAKDRLALWRRQRPCRNAVTRLAAQRQPQPGGLHLVSDVDMERHGRPRLRVASPGDLARTCMGLSLSS